MKTIAMYRPRTLSTNLFQNALNNVYDDFDRFFEPFFGDSFLAPVNQIFQYQPAVDIKEKNNAYTLEMDLPGFDEKDIAVKVDGNNLVISTKKEETFSNEETAGNEKVNKKDEASPSKESEASQEHVFILKERKISAFSRAFKLPENSDGEQVKATFKNGVLSLEIPKKAEAQKRIIQINAA
jgi:HSP20 family protein